MIIWAIKFTICHLEIKFNFWEFAAEMENFGHFVIYEEINSGGAAVIYRAKNKTTGRQVALKVLHQHLSRQPEYKKRIQRESKFISGIKHPNLVRIYSSGEINGKAYIEMEYFKSRTLNEFISRKKQIKMSVFYSLAAQIAEGLSALHKKNIIHRDLSYGNILINDKNEVKITDFGLIKILPENTQFSKITQLTAAGNTFGTLYFMSPEQLDGQDMGKESDIFSFGVNLYYMLTGKLPFTGKTGAAVISSITTREPDGIIQYNRNVSFDLQALVLNLLSKKPENRIKGIHQIGRMLSLFAEKEKVSVKFRPFIIKPWLLFTSVAFFIITFLLLTVISIKQHKSISQKDSASHPLKNGYFAATSAGSSKEVTTSFPLDDYLNFNFGKYSIHELEVKGFNNNEAQQLKTEFVKTITLIKGKDIEFADNINYEDADDCCNIMFKMIRSNSRLILIEEWSSKLIGSSYRKEVETELKPNESWREAAKKLFMGSSLLKTSSIMFEKN